MEFLQGSRVIHWRFGSVFLRGSRVIHWRFGSVFLRESSVIQWRFGSVFPRRIKGYPVVLQRCSVGDQMVGVRISISQ